MAYGLKYRYSFKDFKSTSTFRLDLLQVDYVDSATLVDEGNDVQLKKRGNKNNQDSVIEGSELTFNLLAIKNVREFNDVIESNYKDFKVELYKDGSLYWVGYVKPENLNKEYFDNKYFVNFSATDGLADLKDILYVPSTTTPKIPIIQLVKECLTPLGLELDFKVQLNTYETTLSTSTGCTLIDTFINSKRFTKTESARIVYSNCYKAIEDTLRIFNVKLKQSEGKYYIVNNLEYDSFIYSIDFATLTQQSRVANNLAIDIDSLNFNNSSSLERIRPLKRVNTTFLNRNDGETAIADWENNWTVTDSQALLLDDSVDDRLNFSTQFQQSGLDFYVAESAPFTLEYFDDNDVVIINFKLFDALFYYDTSNNNNKSMTVYIGLVHPDGTVTNKEFTFLNKSSDNDNFSVLFQDTYPFFETGDYKLRVEIPFLQVSDLGAYSFTFSELEIIGAVGEEGVTAITFDRFYQATSDLTSIDDVDYTLLFGDSVQYGDIGALKINDTNTENWNRYNKTDGLSIQEIFTFQKLINKGYYKNYLRLKIYDYALDIENHNVILLDGKYYQILNFTRDFNKSTTSVEMVEILITDVPYTIEEIELSSIDGDDTKTYSTSTNVTNTGTPYELPIASSTVLGGVKVGNGLSINVDGVVAVTATTSGGTSTLPTFSANKVIVSDGNGDLTADLINVAELNALEGISGNIEDALESKASVNDTRIINGQTAYEKKVNSITVTGSNSKVITLSLQDGSTLTSAFTDINNAPDGDEYINSLNWSSGTGVLTVGRTGGLSNITVNLDGRYLTTTPNLPASKITSGTFANARISSSSVIQHLGNYVDRTTAQTIGGNKTFSNNVYVNGNVGISDTTPSYKLDVNGTIRATGDVLSNSDITLKENIVNLSNPLNKILALRGVNFNWKSDDNKELSAGVIAQEVEKEIPEVVKTDDKDIKSVDYPKLTAYLIESIKDLQSQITELKNRK